MTDKWKLVPVEPTDEMKRALFTNLVHADDEAYVIKAIINAAPQPPHIEQIASREAFQTLKGTSAYLKLQLAIQDNAPNLKRYESVMLAENLAEFVWQAAQAEQAKLIAELIVEIESLQKKNQYIIDNFHNPYCIINPLNEMEILFDSLLAKAKKG